MLTPWFRKATTTRPIRRKAGARKLILEALEDRTVPTTYTVFNTGDSGADTFRQAIIDANDNPGPDDIRFDVAGTITLTSGSLPDIIDEVNIDATLSALYIDRPVVQVDFGNFGGLNFVRGSSNSALRGLSLVNAADAGASFSDVGNVVVAANYIGIDLDGTTVRANRGNGLSFSNVAYSSIGGDFAADRNVISGNGGDGIALDLSSDNWVLSNYIGVDAGGTLDRGNGGNGVFLTHGSAGNFIGCTVRNVISGNQGYGVLIEDNSNFNSVSDNLIGLTALGDTARSNDLGGVKIQDSDDNLIGNDDPVSSIDYYDTSAIVGPPVSGWQGIRGSDTPGQFLMAGTSDTSGLLFDGTMDGTVGTSTLFNVPHAYNTSIYGPDNLSGSQLRLVGSYKNPDYATAPVTVHGFLFEGTTAEANDPTKYRTIDYPGAKYNYVHSTMGGLAVGNYDSPLDHGSFSLPLGPGHAYIYDIAHNTFLTDVVYPGSNSNTAYGIWYNGGASYTICGGYSDVLGTGVNNFDDQSRPLGQAYMVDYDSSTGLFTNWASFNYPTGYNIITHFESISSVEKGVYTLSADSVQLGGGANPVQGSFVSVRRNTDGSFGEADWVDLNYTGLSPLLNVTSSNSVYGNNVVGIVIGLDTFSFQATINSSFQLSNVISGNGGNGITLVGANNNIISMNYIGTDTTGTIDLGNGANGILVTSGSSGNMIGGQATGGNNPTGGGSAPVFVRPPQGNLISGNNGNGVLINAAATMNTLSGNFIGTTASGIAPLGNALDGVAIDSANRNEIIGCTFQQDPFVFYNVISGNGGNGLSVTNANNTKVQANFFGMGADNTTGVGNGLDGVLLQGSSANTQFGGVIPLGNVVVANKRNGLEIAGTVSGTVVFNTFCGLPAFKIVAVPNVLDGMLITSTGGNNLIRTNVISGNGNNGVHISGNATGVQVTEAIIGMDTNGGAAIPNGANGILVDGNAHDNLLGGDQASVILQTTISANGSNGIAIVGNAANNTIVHSFIGVDITGLLAFPNGGAGVFIGGNAIGTIIGGTTPFKQNVISGNQGAGIQLSGQSTSTQIINNLIGVDRNGLQPIGNHGPGVWVLSSANAVGGSAANEGNNIANNLFGVLVDTGTGNAITENSIHGNSVSGITLVNNGNLNQIAPVLTGAYQPTPNTIQISGTLTAAPNTTYTVELFASPSGSSGQGQTLVTTLSVLTNAIGVGTFVAKSAFNINAGNTFTATATNPADNTSAFSAAISFGANANTLFVASVYSLLLGRVPDASASYWVGLLNSGATPASVILSIEGSTEYLTDQVDAMYVHYLNRPADAGGQTYWVGTLLAGGTLEQVAAGLASSDEFFVDQGSTNRGYVIGLYADVLGRVASTPEVDAWVAQLDAGATRLSVATAFLISQEYRQDLVQADYNTFLKHAADPGGLAYWVGKLNAGATDQQILAGIFGSPEGYKLWS